MITWIGEPLRGNKRCKTRLSNGKLCPRMDLNKCPLHGVIIDRDDEGFPLKEMHSTGQSTNETEFERQKEEEYLMDLEAGTGKSFVDKKSKKRKHCKVTVRQRLEKKLFDPRTLKRVSAVLDAARKAKIQRKFGQQFAHSLSK
ncbi:hypothetical protein DICVIV_10110 [Dictyocaulus viviparus]|uniref:UV-stimulated scaffold protein A C-terminal domain-containing protein n=1 Tax=Dictyocaulus viviparus TaxID=29172 RepID=A0A0D8XH05_DICVI|nr:hypothetical protein DICVIV_10110 [Dictyocaulus viviparus]